MNKMRMGVAAAGCLLLLGAWSVWGDDAADAAARFCGGSYDGYDRGTSLATGRYSGSSYDGYAVASTTGATLPQRGTVFFIR